jgi:hypothetical protein
MARGLALLLGIAALVTGCGSGSGRATMTVRERFEPVQVPNRVSGTTTRAGQAVRNDCAIGAVYTVREATGTAYLTQSEIVHLRLHPRRRGTSYDLECLGPLVVELPRAAKHVEATARDRRGGGRESLTVRTNASIRLAPGRPLRPASGKQIVVVEWPRRPGPAHDDFRLELSFELPTAQLIRERVVYTASVSCGSSNYLQPVVPLRDDLGYVNAFTVPPHRRSFDFILPRIAAGISSHNEETASLACVGG